jgi:lysophospholipase L1-like esterase
MEKIINRLHSQEANRILFTGDSITHGALHTYGWRDYEQLFSERLRYELVRKRDIVIKSAISGWTTQDIRNDIEWNILQFRPDIVFIMLGMNDAANGKDGITKFQDNYNHIIDKLEKNNSLIVLQTMNPIWDTPAATGRRELPLYVEAIRNIASIRNIPIIDHYAYWNLFIRKVPFRIYEMMDDELHPNDRGHRVMARLLFENLAMWDIGNSRVCKHCNI